MASKLEDFLDLIECNIFYTSEHNPIKVVVHHDIPQQNLETFPLPKTCNACSKRFKDSGIASAIGAVEWENVTGSMFDPNSLVSLCIHKIVAHV